MAGHLIAFEYPSMRRMPGFGFYDLASDPWDLEPSWPSLFCPTTVDDIVLRHLHPAHSALHGRRRKLRKSMMTGRKGASSQEVRQQKEEEDFSVRLDVSHFQPEELTVKTTGNRVIVHARHEEKQDEHGYIEREFTRTYLLPEDVDPDTVKSCLSGDGVLSIEAPKKRRLEASTERVIPIEHMEVETTSEDQGQK
nr:small heat shock protein [Carpetania matritensis]